MISIDSIQKKQFISIFQMLKNTSNTIQIHITEDNFHIQGMDSSHVCLYDITLIPSFFCDYKIEKNNEICLDSTVFSQILSFGVESEKIQFYIEEDTIEIHVIGKKDTKNFKIPLIDNNYDWMGIPETADYDVEFLIDTKIIQEYCGQLLLFGDTINMNCNETNIFFSTSGTNGDMKIEVKIDDLIEYSLTEGMNMYIHYSLNYIQKILLSSKVFDQIKFHISKTLPLKISYPVINSSVDFYIAPKIDDDSI
jgi:proliferating cell nuclear antigen PCNA